MVNEVSQILVSSAPQVVLVVTCLWILLLAAASKGLARHSAFASTIVGLFLSFLLIVLSWGRSVSAPMIRLDHFSLSFQALTVIGALLTILLSWEFLRDEGLMGRLAEYCALLLLACVGAMFLVSATDLVTLFLSLDTLSLALYVLAGYASHRPYPTEAALKYLLLGAMASAFLAYGIAFLYGATGTTDIFQIATGLKDPSVYGSIGAGLFLIGLFFKIAFVPFHQWAPDVYEGSVTPVAAFMTTVPKVAALGAFFRVFSVALEETSVGRLSTEVLVLVSFLTMTLGNLSALPQTSVKRMLAYSSIAHAGYMALALLSKTKEAAVALFFYGLSYTLMTVGAFAVTQMVEEKGGRPATWQELTGLAYRDSVLGFCMAIFMAGLTGIPFTAGFWAKVIVFKVALEAQYVGLVVVAVLNTVVSAYYYLRIVWSLYETRNPSSAKEIRLWSGVKALILLCALWVLILGIVPALVLNLPNLALF
ncbi:MAG: NADH-quinone oxidoreductase subunit N [Armatimonadetes bacterium]|nr:NADH-quinone oxidoreductase subunit N [Armatimonadota bacterium]MDW8120792.1 NADH-quinone oxidoreductase subunit N [Armatimonadota bacterium]